MKWFIVALISPNVDAFGLVDLYVYTHPFPTQIECQVYAKHFENEIQLDLNDKHNSVNIQYPVVCVIEKELYNSLPDST